MSLTYKDWILSLVNSEIVNADIKLVEDLIFCTTDKDRQFPIDMQKLLDCKMYNLKCNVKTILIRTFTEGEDYETEKVMNKKGRPTDNVYLSVDCFKKMCMLSSAKNSDVHGYYIALEKLFQKYMEEEFQRLGQEKKQIAISNNSLKSIQDLVFNNTELTGGKQLRVFGDSDNPLFVAKEVAEMLGYTDPDQAIRKHIDDEDKISWKDYTQLKVGDSPTFNLHPQTILINESGLYSLILRSKLQKASIFKRWVTSEVLPSIRKSGQYKLECSMSDRIKQLEDNHTAELTRRDQEIEVKDERIDSLKKSLLDEETFSMKLKQKLIMYAPKNTFRYKFDAKPCIYVLHDPDNKYAKYKIGKSADINARLAQDRTMIPQLKVRLILYTPHYSLFEDVIKVKFDLNKELPSHEWIFRDLTELIEGIKNINRTNNFYGEEELNLWKYNMEDPPSEDNVSTVIDLTGKVKKDSENTGRKVNTDYLAERLHRILPFYLPNCDVIRKNDEAPDGQRFCNGFCQDYINASDFTAIARGLIKICNKCRAMEVFAYTKINSGELTCDQIRQNVNLVIVEENEKACIKCTKIQHISNYDNRNTCNKCHYQNNKVILDVFEKNIDAEIDILDNSSEHEQNFLIKNYTKDELRLMVKYLKLGRKSTDKKHDLVHKLLNHYGLD